MSKKTKVEQEVQQLEICGTVIHTNHRDNIIVVLGSDGLLYRYEYPRESVFSEWEEGFLVRVYYSKSKLATIIHTMEELSSS